MRYIPPQPVTGPSWAGLAAVAGITPSMAAFVMGVTVIQAEIELGKVKDRQDRLPGCPRGYGNSTTGRRLRPRGK